MKDWGAFFAAELGASATLAGLVAVAISINLQRILEVEHLPARAGESLFSLTMAFAVCSVALFPDLSPRALGAVALTLSAAAFLFGARNQIVWGRMSKGQEWARKATGASARIASTFPIAAGGALALAGGAAGVFWIAVGVVVTLVAAVLNAWVLLVEIKR
jgi:hypothetical protein